MEYLKIIPNAHNLCMTLDVCSETMNEKSSLVLTHLPCFTHTINLIAECSLNIPSFKGPITKVRDIVKWAKNSVINSDKLTKIQTDSGVPES
ncbi:hypothetical protein PR048_026721 [Dryococelus australis]|uniref:Uncharacterized protein n=1 Tax=Dryococelus australis TaxID=614101 RepID=A0ABQ9GM62_9NEOP|nr:hypothetical protein PR048_026721 [Dryococelus australis]